MAVDAAQLSLSKTVIESPIDGVVISRNVLARFGGTNAQVDAWRSNTVWTVGGRTLTAAVVTTGITDSVYTEILAAPFGEGTPVVTRMAASTTP